jgi:hypothetical protein
MTAGGVEVVFVTVTVPLVFVTTRIGDTTRAVPVARVVEIAVDEDVVVAGRVTRRLPSGGLAARVGLGVAADVSVGVSTFVAAAFVGVAVIAAVVGVAVVLVSVGVVMIAAVVGVAVAAEIVGATGAALTVDAAVDPLEAITTPPPPPSPVMTGIGSELMDAFTVPCGLAYADGGMSWPVGCAGCAGFGCGPDGLIVPRNRSR